MNRKVIGWIVGSAFAVGVAAIAWLWFAGGSGEPSTELTTPTIASSPTTQAGEAPTTSADGEDGAGPRSFVIEAGGDSVATFEIDEELQGSPKRVVGTTNEVAGQVSVDLTDLSSAQFSDIVINARTFATDSDRRDRAIRGPVILNSASDEFEFVTFTPTSIDGLSGSLEVGGSVEFIVTGDITIKGTTQTVSFDVTATLVDDSTIEGTASTQVLRSDFEIGIPSVPGVANVADEVALSLDFTAISG